jgi:peptidoglycan/xylan/chitin deacetylase (PgdA/CDA1 family)
LSTLINTLLGQGDCRGMVAITFDDGYLNNFECASPILKKSSMSAAFFLATGFIGADRWAWTDRLEYLVASAHKSGDRSEFLRSVKSELKDLDWKVAESRVQQIGAEFGVSEARPHGQYRFMSWDNARALVHAGFEVGAHTVNHAILSRVPLAKAEEEILGSQSRLRAETGQCCATFCYPNGKKSDFTPEVMGICSRNFDAALAAIPGTARLAERFEIRRIGIDCGTSVERLAARILTGA